jgi:hypothetical protein
MVNNPKIKDGFLTYECGGEGCTSPDGTHSVPISELVAHASSIAEELLFEGDPRGPNVYIVAAMFKYIATGDADISNVSNDPEYATEFKDVMDKLVRFYDKAMQHLVIEKKPTLLPLAGTNKKDYLN